MPPLNQVVPATEPVKLTLSFLDGTQQPLPATVFVEEPNLLNASRPPGNRIDRHAMHVQPPMEVRTR